MDLSITNLEAERQRRQIALIEHAARIGAELPKPEIYVGGRFTDIKFNTFKIHLEDTFLEGDFKSPVVAISNKEMEEKLNLLFPDQAVAKKLYGHICKAIEEYMGKYNGTVERYGDTKLCG